MPINKPEIKLINGYYHDRQVVKIEFDYNPELIDFIRENTPAVWSANLNCWYIPVNKFKLADFLNVMEPVALIDFSNL